MEPTRSQHAPTLVFATVAFLAAAISAALLDELTTAALLSTASISGYAATFIFARSEGHPATVIAGNLPRVTVPVQPRSLRG